MQHCSFTLVLAAHMATSGHDHVWTQCNSEFHELVGNHCLCVRLMKHWLGIDCWWIPEMSRQAGTTTQRGTVGSGSRRNCPIKPHLLGITHATTLQLTPVPVFIALIFLILTLHHHPPPTNYYHGSCSGIVSIQTSSACESKTFLGMIILFMMQASRSISTVRPACTASRRVSARAEEPEKLTFKPNNNAVCIFLLHCARP